MSSLDLAQLDPDPLPQFARWFDAWTATRPVDPTAMILSTVDRDGQPWSRTVLLKQQDARGFVFFTNRESNKGEQLADNARAALHFLWLSATPDRPTRQVLVQGTVERTTPTEDDAYFASRPRDSQLGAWASQQSRPLESRAALLARFEALQRQYAGGDVPRPPHWGGYRVLPQRIEFWQAGDHRLHDRFVYTRSGDRWAIARLNP
ncbi:MAG: pyridoxamine 5'-phosphate oxidase [Pseudomonadota bacterium]